MQRRWLLLVAAAVLVVVLMLYTSEQCRVSGQDLGVSSPKMFVVPVEQGYVAGFSFNVTNGADCEINARSIHAVLRGVVFVDGNQTEMQSEESESIRVPVAPNETKTFSYTLDPYFGFRPSKLLLRIEIAFEETEPVVVFDGELSV